MTYYDCRFIGLENTWDNKTGVKLDKTGIAGAYRDYKGTTKNKKVDTAKMATFNIKVNGKNINNSKEKYPFLTYRNVTYFPMTWNYCSQEFGITYKFDNNCLNVKSSNSKLEKKDIVGCTNYEMLCCVDGFIYYCGEKGCIYQAPVNNLNNAKKIYQLPIWSYGDGTTYVYPCLYEKDNEACLYYFQGGATMGEDYCIKFNKDGIYEEEEVRYQLFKKYKNITLKLWEFPEGGNLFIRYNDEDDYKSVGDKNLCYIWWRREAVYLKDDNVYVLGSIIDKDKFSNLYKVNIKTNETIKLTETRADDFRMDNEFIYFTNEGKLYRLPISGNKEEAITTVGTIEDFILLNKNIYYINDKDKLYKVGSNKGINEAGIVTGFKLDDNYLIVTFKEEKTNPYRMIVIDKEGKIIFKTADVTNISSVYIEDGKLGYMENSRKGLYITDL
jgi:hypothetical protein